MMHAQYSSSTLFVVCYDILFTQYIKGRMEQFYNFDYIFNLYKDVTLDIFQFVYMVIFDKKSNKEFMHWSKNENFLII